MNDLCFSESFPETPGRFGGRTTNNQISPSHGLCMDSVQRLVIPASQSVEHDPVIEVAEIIPNVSEDFTIASCRLSGPGGGAARMAWSVTRSKRLKLFPLLAAMDLTRSKRSGPYRPRVRRPRRAEGMENCLGGVAHMLCLGCTARNEWSSLSETR